jgi:hypothetical protein
MAGPPWQIFPTVTSDHRTHPEALLKRWRYMWSRVNRELYGNNWSRRAEGVRWVAGLERHASWNPHLHGMVYAPGFDLTDPGVFPFTRWHGEFKATGGNVDLKVIQSPAALLAYITKYVLKDGEISWSDGLTVSDLHEASWGRAGGGGSDPSTSPPARIWGLTPATAAGQAALQFRGRPRGVVSLTTSRSGQR